ncbi:TFS1 [Candida theae]|uniref:TFS1 n=1 Tax=Candida theae TaxID=1198502 RepID=A0AAD5BA81_9ASCO|nr:TFS1 [Candida theae]KAI5949097.1 TFS1 [Candida theae]
MLNKLSSTAILNPLPVRRASTTHSLLKSIATTNTNFSRSLFHRHSTNRRYKDSSNFNTLLTSKMTLITISQSLDEAFTKNKIVPDVVDDFETQGLLSIEYGPTELVTLGNTLPVSGTQHQPKIQLTLNSPTEDGKIESIGEQDKFILVLTDPDAPSNSDHKWSEYLHWLVTDITLPNLKTESGEPEISHFIDASSGKVVFKYEGPGPPPKTGKHRYVFLLFKQDPKTITFEKPKDRPTWGTGTPSSGVRDWIKANAPGSKLLAVNFFYAQNEDN